MNESLPSFRGLEYSLPIRIQLKSFLLLGFILLASDLSLRILTKSIDAPIKKSAENASRAERITRSEE
jgi:hypothetical protein